MKRILLPVVAIASLWLSLSLSVVAEESGTSKPIEDAVLKLEQQWEDALIKSDSNVLEKLYDEAIIYTHSNGKVDTKASYISAIQSGATKYGSMKRDDIKVVVYGQTAVVSCHWDVHVLARGAKVDMNARYLHVYVEKKDGWKLVAHQSTKVGP